MVLHGERKRRTPVLSTAITLLTLSVYIAVRLGGAGAKGMSTCTVRPHVEDPQKVHLEVKDVETGTQAVAGVPAKHVAGSPSLPIGR